MTHRLFPEFDDTKIGARLRLIRRIEDLNQTEFGAKANLTQNRYNQYELGKKRLSVEAAIALCGAYNLTLDWIYLGDAAGLRGRMIDAINGIRNAETTR
jgi:transcriptional regulator with XRE-family HTH domain